MTRVHDEIPPLFAGLCDDAALFPPGNAAARDAVPAHHEYRGAWYRDLVGPFLAAARHLPAVIETVDAAYAVDAPNAADAAVGAEAVSDGSAASDREAVAVAGLAHAPLPLVLVVPDGPAALGAALQAGVGVPGIELVGVELACGPDGSSGDAARAAAEALAHELPAGVAGVVEVRRDAGLGDALDVLAARPLRAKFRTGGTVAQAFPTETELAAFIAGCVARGLPFKCTAGLHEAVRHTDRATGFEHHGFLNILSATAAATAGADEAEIASVLGVRSGPDLVDTLRVLTPDAITRTRRAFTAYGTCSIAEPLADLMRLGALWTTEA